MDFDNRKVYGDTSITDGLVRIWRAPFSMPDFFKGYEDCFFSSPKTEGYGFLNKLLQVSESLAAASTRPMRHRLFLALLGLLKALFDPF